MKATRLLLLFTLVFAVVSGASGQSISGQSPIVRDRVVFWPLAFQFDGSGPTIDVGNSSRLNTSTFTISAFVKFNALSHPPGSNGGRPAGDMSIVDKISNTEVDNADGWRLLKQDVGLFMFCFGGGLVNGCTGDPSAPTVFSTTAPVVGVWYNVVGVLSKTEIAIYVNGVKEGSKPLSSFTDTHSAHMRIGSSAQGGGYAFFDGLIDEVTFHPKALDGKDIEALCAEKNGDVPCHAGKH
jgi:Concanavalin A-like lectin/glucanases superfamily